MKIRNIRNHKTIKTGLNYSLASSLSSIVNLLITILSMRWIGPEYLGIWQSVAVVNFYIIFLQLGIQSGLNLELPLLFGQKKQKEAIEHISSALCFAIVLAVFFFIVNCFISIYLIVCGVDEIIVYTAFSIGLLAVINCFKLHYIATFRSAIAFDKLSNVFYIDLGVNLIFIPMIYYFSYYGYISFQVGKETIVTGLMWYFAPYRNISPHYLKSSFHDLLKRGLFMTFVNQTKGFVESSSRVLILYFGDYVKLGLFTPALSIRTVMDLIPAQISQFLNPQFGYKYGRTKKAQDMWKYLKYTTLIIPLACIPLVIIGWIIMPYVLDYVFPKYTESLSAIRLTLIGFVFSSTYISRGFLITIKAYRAVALLYTLDIILFFGIPFVIVKTTSLDILLSIASGMSVSYLVSYIYNIVIVRITIFKDKYNK